VEEPLERKHETVTDTTHERANINTMEYTLRSVMGEYGGYVGYLEVERTDEGQYRYNFFGSTFVIMYFISVLLGVSLFLMVALVTLMIAHLWSKLRTATAKTTTTTTLPPQSSLPTTTSTVANRTKLAPIIRRPHSPTRFGKKKLQ
jgi:hypothetical protein